MKIEQIRERRQGIHEDYHHTYQEEKRMWDYMQLGDAIKVYHWNYRLLENAGKLSDDTQTHWYNMILWQSRSVRLLPWRVVFHQLKLTESAG